MLLTRPTHLSDATRGYLEREAAALHRLFAFGGEAALNESTLAAARTAIE